MAPIGRHQVPHRPHHRRARAHPRFVPILDDPLRLLIAASVEEPTE